MAIDPIARGAIEKGAIKKDERDLSSLSIDGLMYHIQGIAEVGDEYIVLSTSANDKALILIHKKKIVHIEPLLEGYEHAGGIDVLATDNGWLIAVPAWAKDSDEAGAICFYFLSQGQGCQATLQYKNAYRLQTERLTL